MDAHARERRCSRSATSASPSAPWPPSRASRFPLYAGEAHALVGENGAGKSTLVKMLAGVHRPDTGTLAVDGDDVDFAGPADAQAAGIAVIYQEPTLFPDLSVAENIFMGRQPLRPARPDRPRARCAQPTAELFARLGVALDPDRPARGLSIADQQIVEIAKALSVDARVLVMDEPTAALSGVEVDRLFAVVRSLRERGRRGAVHLAPPRGDLRALPAGHDHARRRARLHRAGRRPHRRRDGPPDGRPRPRRAVPQAGRDARRGRPRGRRADPGGRLHATCPSACGAGEIVALAGLVGAGRSEVAAGGLRRRPRDAGDGRGRTAGRCKPDSPRAAMAAGLALVPEDRRQQGLVMDLSIERNVDADRGRGRWPGSACSSAGRSARAAADWAERLQMKYAPARRPGRHAVRRQPAEGRAGQVAGHRAAGADRRRADPRHRRRHQGRGAPAAVRAGRRRASRC